MIQELICTVLALTFYGCAPVSKTTPTGAPKGDPGESGESGAVGATGEAGKGCSVAQNSVGALISCQDGTNALILHGQDGKDSVSDYCLKHPHKKICK